MSRYKFKVDLLHPWLDLPEKATKHINEEDDFEIYEFGLLAEDIAGEVVNFECFVVIQIWDTKLSQLYTVDVEVEHRKDFYSEVSDQEFYDGK